MKPIHQMQDKELQELLMQLMKLERMSRTPKVKCWMRVKDKGLTMELGMFGMN